jgi:spoIIIJ-associated protein
MEWVETTAETIEAAKELALDQLGVAEEDAEFEVLEEPKPGLFGRVRGEARVRARVKPTTPRAKADRRDSRKRRGGRPGQDEKRSEPKRQTKPAQAAPSRQRAERAERPAREDRPERSEPRESVDPSVVVAAATTFLTGLAAAAGVTGTVTSEVNGEDIDLNLDGDGVEMFVGPKGNTLSAVQDLTRVVSQRRLGDHDTKLRVDIGHYRQKRKDALSRFAMKVANDVLSSGQARVLEPMNSADRKVVHDTLLEVDGIETRSEGEEPNRRVVVDLVPGD